MMNKTKLSLIGFLQALGVVIYCSLIASLFWFFKIFSETPPEFWGTVLMLTLLVFSASVTGSLVFGYSAYLVLNQRIKEALTLLAYTLLYFLGIIGIIIIALFVLK